MKIFKIFISAILSFSLLASCVEAQNKKKNSKKTNSAQTTKNSNKPMETKTDSNIKILAEVSYSQVETPFVFVARSKETYATLKKLVENLPAETEIDFNKQAVVAAFAGTRNKGGYSVEIKKSAEKVAIEVIAPPKVAMVTQALTQHFNVGLV